MMARRSSLTSQLYKLALLSASGRAVLSDGRQTPKGRSAELGGRDRDALCSTTGTNDGRPDREPDQLPLLIDGQ